MGELCLFASARYIMQTVLLLLAACVAAPALSARLPYIVGGDDAQPGAWPWQASIQMFGSHICGAAIISNNWLVTAAHCVEMGNNLYSVVLGMHDRQQKNQGKPVEYKISKIIQHPGWSKDSANGFPNDIALMQLRGRADLSGKFATAVKMADVGADFLGNRDCFITGWGKTGFVSAPANILKEAKVDVYSESTCKAAFGDIIGKNHICVGKKNKSGACSGDSGGPLVCKTGTRYTLAGVTSFGVVTCSTSVPSVYSRISYFRDWIKDNSGV